MLSNVLAAASVAREYVSLVDIIAYRRPPANRLFDQIYMMTGDMLTQVDLMQDYIKDKNVVFLGDGDGMSMLFGLFSVNDIISSSKQITVLDFDERIIKNIERFSTEFEFSKKFDICCEKYNVIDIVPENHKGKYDFFYINPPYGSKNNGLSCETWLHRCMDLCTVDCSGCIVIPYDTEQAWAQDAMINIQKFLLNNGFVLRDMVSYLHSYHLEDNPILKSATLIVDRISDIKSEFSSKKLTREMLKNLYGKPRPIPRYILDDGSIYGKEDYDWEFGANFWKDE